MGKPTQTQPGEGKHTHWTMSCGNYLKEPQILATLLILYLTESKTLTIALYFLFYVLFIKKEGNSMAVQWLGLSALTAEGQGSIPGWGTKIPRAKQSKKKGKKRLPIKLGAMHSYDIIFIFYLFKELFRLILAIFLLCITLLPMQEENYQFDKLAKMFLKLLPIRNPTPLIQ